MNNRFNLRVVVLGLCSLVVLGAVTLGTAARAWADDPGKANRYPYDPVCSWGRVADGRGMMVRCIKQGEAEALLAGKSPASPSKEPDAPPTDAAPEQLTMEVGPVQVDSGSLPLALKKLKVPADRYLACVEKHGGITKQDGEVHIRFLVRERGRAEGAVVKKRRAVSEKAAACIADVVDRRFVGHPDVPIVGATLVVKFSRASR
jgi:hypothetical protein